MRKEKSIQTVVIGALVAIILVMSVGFAAYERALTITGTTTFTAAKWDVHFVPNSLTETSTLHASATNLQDTTATYTVTLPSPGSTYSFEVNIKNFGTIPAYLKKITMTGLTDANRDYITYTVSYNGTSYSQTTDGLNILLPADGTTTATVTVTVNYIYPDNASDLPQTDQQVTLTAAFDYDDGRA